VGCEKGSKVVQQMQSPLIQFSNIFKKFGTNQVFRGVNLRIFQKQVPTIIGKSGIERQLELRV
jgi:phospholipid/cholesterol/gamma-HCH transport system ATP-binding protein